MQPPPAATIELRRDCSPSSAGPAAVHPPLDRDHAGPARPPNAFDRFEQLIGRRVHLVGVGGSGMSGLAAMLHRRGVRVSGEDAAPGAALARLAADGVPVWIGEVAPIEGGRLAEIELVIASTAIPPDHPTLAATIAPRLTYPQALGLLQRDSTAVCIAGTHGKSTTTSMLGHLLIHAGLDPGVIVGAHCPTFGGGARVGAPRIPAGSLVGAAGILVAEACEYRCAFHHHHPTLALINNVEEDHLDAFGSLDEIVEAFRVFASRLPPAACGGRLLIAHDGAQRERVAAATHAEVETFGTAADATWQIRHDGAGRVELWSGGGRFAAWRCPLPGAHSALNSAAAAILAHRLGAATQRIVEGLESFPGLERRMQVLGQRRIRGGLVTVVDDYGHHPTECAVTLEALRRHHAPRRLLCVFQPHQHSRTRFLLDRFAESFSAADLVLVPDIHFVRDSEAERRLVSSADLVDRLRRRGVAASHIPCLEQLLGTLETTCTDGDLLVVMGAGPIDALAHAFLSGPRTPADGEQPASVEMAC